MSNPYYTFDTPLTPGTRGRAGELNDQFLAIQTGFDNIPGPGGASFAAPTVKVGLTADGGVLSTALRSDAKLVLDEAITPRWTGFHKYTHISGIEIESAQPRLLLDETDAATNERMWRITAGSGRFVIGALNDLEGSGVDAISIERTGTTIDSIDLVSTALTWNGTQLPSLSANNVFTNDFPAFRLSSANPGFELYETDAVLNGKLWRFIAQGGALTLQARTDADVFAATPVTITRTGTTVDSIALVATAITLNGVPASDFTRLSQDNIFTGSTQIFRATAPQIIWQETDAPADEQYWMWRSAGGAFILSTAANASGGTPVSNAMSIDRTGTTVDSIALTSTAFTWNGDQVATRTANTFTGIQTISAANPWSRLFETDAATNEKYYSVESNGGVLSWRTYDDALSGTNAFLSVDRTGITVDSIALASTALTWNGNTLFTTANDGTGSGLDADLLDGSHLSALAQLSAANVFTGTSQTLTRATPSFRWSDTGASSGARAYAIQADSGSLFFQLWNDAFASGASWMSVQRTNNVATFVNLTSTNLLWNGAPLALSSTYTPTLSNALNISSSTSALCNYIQVGNTVTVSGSVSVTRAGGTAIQLGISLPVASNFTTGAELGGAGRHDNAPVGIVASTANDYALAEWVATTASAARMDFTFTYRIV